MKIAGARKKIRVGDLLVEAGAITEEQLQEALAKQKESGGRIGNIIMQMGFISKELLITVLTAQTNIDYCEIKSVKIDESVLKLVPDSLVNKYKAMPVGFDEKNPNILKVAMADPMDLVAVDDISISSGLQVDPMLSFEEDLNEVIGKYYGSAQAMEAAEAYRKEQQSGELTEEEINQMDDEIDNSPIVLLVNQIIEGGVRQRGSDIHIEPMETYVRVRYRIDGALKQVMTYDYSLAAAISARIKIIGGMDIAEKRKPQDGRITIVVDRREFDVRVSILPTVYGEKTVMRLTSKDGLTKPKSGLGFSPSEIEVFDGILSNPHGIILVTGPTGSGKSTTLASVINKANENLATHIITLEDPIEYIHKHKKAIVNQRELGMDTLSFDNALRAALREDPDIILVGEMRDPETIQIAITAAETGHLVFSTLHTIGAAATIDRIIDVFPPHQQQQIRIQLAMVIEGVISQQLIPTADGKGRVAAFEVMLATPAIRAQIREAKTHQIESTIQTSKGMGMITMDDALVELYRNGIITRDNALLYAQDQTTMHKNLY